MFLGANLAVKSEQYSLKFLTNYNYFTFQDPPELFEEWLDLVRNWFAMWNPRSPMINYSSSFGTRKDTNHPFIRE